MTDDEDSTTIENLRVFLNERAEMPPGLMPRLEAGVSRRARQINAIPAETRIVIACLLFVVIGMSTPGEAFQPITALLLLVTGIAYVLGIRQSVPLREPSAETGGWTSEG